MGFYDRDYYKDSHYDSDAGYYRSRDWSITTWLIVINAALFLINAIITGESNLITNLLSLHGFTIFNPAFYWQFLTYGFVHSPTMLLHILGNMLMLFFFGREIEQRLGRAEFLRFYLLTIVFAGIIYAVSNFGEKFLMLGASGGVVGVVILFALYFPHRTVYFWGLFPLPVWFLGTLYVGYDLWAVLMKHENGVAVAAHLAGAAFAVMYVYLRWNFGKFFGFFLLRKNPFTVFQRRRPPLSVYNPKDEKSGHEDDSSEDLSRQVDEVLKKYSEKGEASLTAEERGILKKASEKYRQRKPTR